MKLTLCHPKMKLMGLMQITKLLTVFDVKASIEDALREGHSGVRLPTYLGEQVSIISGTPRYVKLEGRLDLFACNALRKAVGTIEDAVFDLSDMTEATERGGQRLLDSLAGTESVIYLPAGVPFAALETHPLVYREREQAIAAHFDAIRKEAAKWGPGEPRLGGTLATYFLH